MALTPSWTTTRRAAAAEARPGPSAGATACRRSFSTIVLVLEFSDVRGRQLRRLPLIAQLLLGRLGRRARRAVGAELPPGLQRAPALRAPGVEAVPAVRAGHEVDADRGGAARAQR